MSYFHLAASCSGLLDACCTGVCAPLPPSVFFSQGLIIYGQHSIKTRAQSSQGLGIKFADCLISSYPPY